MKTLNETMTELNIRTKKNFELDEILVRDAHLCLTNEAEFYEQHLIHCYKNLEKKYKKGEFNDVKAVDLIQENIQLYQRKNLHTSAYKGVTINKPERVAIAHQIVDFLVSEMELGNFHTM